MSNFTSDGRLTSEAAQKFSRKVINATKPFVRENPRRVVIAAVSAYMQQEFSFGRSLCDVIAVKAYEEALAEIEAYEAGQAVIDEALEDSFENLPEDAF